MQTCPPSIFSNCNTGAIKPEIELQTAAQIVRRTSILAYRNSTWRNSLQNQYLVILSFTWGMSGALNIAEL